MLPADELARLRDDIQSYTLVDTCAVLAGTATSDGMGGQVIAWGTTIASIACRLDQRAGREALVGGGYHWYTTNILSLPGTAVITTSQRVVYGGVTYAITNVNEGSGIAVKRATLERVG